MSRRDDQIIESYLNGEADDVELRAWLRRDEAHVDAFVEACDLHWQLKDVVADRAAAPGLTESMRIGAIDGREPMRVTWRTVGLAMAAALAIAGALVAVMLAVSGGAEPTEPVRRAVAVMIHDNGAAWSQTPDGDLPAEGATLTNGRYELASGSVVIETLRGATVTLTGPATLSLETDMRAYLHRGYLEAHVPPVASGFEVATPTMSVVDLGTEFGVTVDDVGDAWVDVFEGEVVATALDGGRRRIGPSMALGAGDRATSPSDTRELLRLDGPDAPRLIRQRVTGPIHLGNLFDDDKSQSLARAMQTDTMAAVADASGLGVWRIAQGGDSVQELAPGVWFDFRPLGWAFRAWGSIANDAWTGEPGLGEHESITGIRTTGSSDALGTDRIEQGIGMHADALVVFDLDEVRRAGRLYDKVLRLRVDRAGLNDDKPGLTHALGLAVVVVSRDGLVTAHVNGEPARLRLNADNVWVVDGDTPTLSGGAFVAFDVPLPAGARYVALVATGGGDGIGNDHAVFSGVRLEQED